MSPRGKWAAFVISLTLILTLLLVPSSVAQQQVVSKKQLQELFRVESFDELESIVQRLRKEKSRTPSGHWRLRVFYQSFSELTEKMDREPEREFLEQTERWARNFPDSVTWRIVRAEALISFAWRERGGGLAYTVSEEGWREFEKYLKEAWDLLLETRGISREDPALYATMTTVAMGLGPNLTREPFASAFETLKAILGPPFLYIPTPSVEDLIFQEAVKIEPRYYGLYKRQAVARLPRWGGEAGTLERFAEYAAALAQDQTVYARIASFTLDYVWDTDYKEHHRFDWQRIQGGMDEILTEFPNSTYFRNMYCRMACVYEDRDLAAALLNEIPKPLYVRVWKGRNRFNTYKRWIEGTGPYPRAGALSKAVAEGDDDTVREMIAQGVSLEEIHFTGRSPLLVAITTNHLDTAQILIDAGANIHFVAASGYTPIREAVEKRQSDALLLLLQNGADPDFAGRNGWTALHYCARVGNIEYARILLDAGADIDKPMVQGWTPIHVAVEEGQTEMVRFLLSEGADPALTLESGTSAQKIATRHGYQEILLLLQADTNR